MKRLKCGSVIICGLSADVAQPAEQRFCKPQVEGSSPSVSSSVAGQQNRLSKPRSPGGGSCPRLRGTGGGGEWLMAADCKSAGLRPTKVRILPPPWSRWTDGKTEGRNVVIGTRSDWQPSVSRCFRHARV